MLHQQSTSVLFLCFAMSSRTVKSRVTPQDETARVNFPAEIRSSGTAADECVPELGSLSGAAAQVVDVARLWTICGINLSTAE